MTAERRRTAEEPPVKGIPISIQEDAISAPIMAAERDAG